MTGELLLINIVMMIVSIHITLIVQCDGRGRQEWCCARKTLKWRQKMVLS